MDNMHVHGKETTRLAENQRKRQNYPIQSDLPIKRVYQREPINAASWAYMKLLRETSKIRKIYPVDPYLEVYQFRDNLYGFLAESADGMGDVWMYLILGPEKAMLIDTGFGIGDLKGLVHELAGDREIIVVNTHDHFDHSHGNCQFDRVFCSEYEKPALEKQDAHIWDYLFEEDGVTGIWAEFDRRDIIDWKPYEIVGCEDGTEFDLGDGYIVELIHMGGHTAGHAGFLDRHDRIFFAGDDVNSMRISVRGPRPGDICPEYASINKLRKNFCRLEARLSEFDHVFSSHFITDIESYVIISCRETCDAILEDPVGCAQIIEVIEKWVNYGRYVQGLGTICYTSNAVYRDL